VGYGYDGAVAISDGVRRLRSGLKVAAIGLVRNTAGRTVATANDWVAELGPCGGDSGGPALDELGRVIGVMSRGNPTVCQQMIYTQVAGFRDWAKNTVVEAAGRAGIPVPAWAAEPDAGIDAGAGVDAGVAPGSDAGEPLVIPLATEEQHVPVGCSSVPGVSVALLAWLLRRKRPVSPSDL
jgi:hypothetical protein